MNEIESQQVAKLIDANITDSESIPESIVKE
jgi:hypothetical protein